MKWLAFTLAVVAGLVGLGVWSVMPPSVVWEARTPHCSRCRAEINPYARQCSTCDRAVRWASMEEDCRWCLTEEDVDFLRDSYRALEEGSSQQVKLNLRIPKEYFLRMEAHACTFCAGNGTVKEGGADVTCRVCRGEKSCIGCDGDGDVVIGDEGAHRRLLDRQEAREQAERRSKLTGLPVPRESLVDADVEALTGHVEAETLRDTRGSPLLKSAIARAALAYKALEEAKRESVKDGEE